MVGDDGRGGGSGSGSGTHNDVMYLLYADRGVQTTAMLCSNCVWRIRFDPWNSAMKCLAVCGKCGASNETCLRLIWQQLKTTARKHIVPADLRDIGDYTDKMSASAEIEEIKNASGQLY